mmetsp:Transcript_32160/g.90044  ORF Transcript_32160/g.90044 Transcript_32160/m.90044 type:complete len:242 (-) Transcript_32160:233-958(-)
MMAFRLAIVETPRASEMVTTAGSPSGMMATAVAIAFLKAFCHGNLKGPFHPRKNAAIATITTHTPMTIPMMWSCRWRLVSTFSVELTSLLMRPISARSPVSHTTARASPTDTRVPLNPMHLRSPRPARSSTGSVIFVMASDSPVRMASSTWILFTSTMRTSAGTRSPDLSVTISPGTSWSASTLTISPSRNTMAWGESIALIASAALSALPSCTMPMVTLMKITPRIKPNSIQELTPPSPS